MNRSNKNHLNILDLPNEILFIIFNELNMVDVLYSFVDVTQRLNQLVFDPFYRSNLSMTSMMMKSFNERIYSTDNQILDKICKNVLPRIYHQVKELIVEQYSIDNLIFSFYLLIRDNVILRKLLDEQITHLTIDIKDEPKAPSETLSVMSALILSLCKRLIKLSFCQLFHQLTLCTYELSSTNFKSSTLTSLKMNVKTFDDCLYLIDGHFNCLSTLMIFVKTIAYTSGTIDNTVSIMIDYSLSKEK
ncbi:unnamed protein product [Rotaria magnacalcarata]|uniref:F-box domain-containing protein n=1 Tax=Rotaria magnacalcarata TaxID=392030 RepID=A0A816UFU3_9BILA|nr:unnamed protein product [Rotaria magnacalcarata]